MQSAHFDGSDPENEYRERLKLLLEEIKKTQVEPKERRSLDTFITMLSNIDKDNKKTRLERYKAAIDLINQKLAEDPKNKLSLTKAIRRARNYLITTVAETKPNSSDKYFSNQSSILHLALAKLEKEVLEKRYKPTKFSLSSRPKTIRAIAGITKKKDSKNPIQLLEEIYKKVKKKLNKMEDKNEMKDANQHTLYRNLDLMIGKFLAGEASPSDLAQAFSPDNLRDIQDDKIESKENTLEVKEKKTMP